MNRYNNENIVLDERATRSFLMDLFHPNSSETNSSEIDSIAFSREENENGVTYHFPDFAIDLKAEEKEIENPAINLMIERGGSGYSSNIVIRYYYEELAETFYNSISIEEEYFSNIEKKNTVLDSSNNLKNYYYAA